MTSYLFLYKDFNLSEIANYKEIKAGNMKDALLIFLEENNAAYITQVTRL